jgi:hypothetical protein
MSDYGSQYVWLRRAFTTLQSSQSAVGRLPYSPKRVRVLEQLQAAERALDDLDRELAEEDELAGYGLIADEEG